MRNKVTLTQEQETIIREVAHKGTDTYTNEVNLAHNFAKKMTGNSPCTCNINNVLLNIKNALKLYDLQNKNTESNESFSTEATA